LIVLEVDRSKSPEINGFGPPIFDKATIFAPPWIL